MTGEAGGPLPAAADSARAEGRRERQPSLLPLMRSLVIAIRGHLDNTEDSLHQNPSFNHVCRGPFPMLKKNRPQVLGSRMWTSLGTLFYPPHGGQDVDGCGCSVTARLSLLCALASLCVVCVVCLCMYSVSECL